MHKTGLIRKHADLFWQCRLFVITILLYSSVLAAQSVTLKVIETTDVHGMVFPYDFINDRPTDGSLAQVHTYVKSERQKKDQHVILLSAGDILQGQPTVYYYNFDRPDEIHFYARVMNYMGYDAGAVGNHDIEPGHAVYDKFTGEVSFPWLAANAVKADSQEPYFEPYTMIERAGVRIAILGMVTPKIPTWLPEKIWEGMEFRDMIETAKRWMPIIRETEKPDLIFGLFHSGVDFTYAGETATSPRNENGSRLVAEQVSGFDIVFVGHDHGLWNMTVRNPADEDVHILGGGARAKNVAVATIKLNYDRATQSWNKHIAGEIMSMQGYDPDPEFMNEFAAEFAEVKTYVGRKIGTFTRSITTRDAIFGNSAFVDLVHGIQLQLTGADLSISGVLSLDAQIQKGPVFVRDMFKLYRYENLLYTMTLTGQEIKDFLEYSYGGWFNHMQDKNDHLLKFKLNEHGEIVYTNAILDVQDDRDKTPVLHTSHFNYDSMAGLDYVVDVSKAKGERVKIRSLSNGLPFRLEETYKVAINSYRGNGGGGHLTEGAGIRKAELAKRIVATTEKDLRFFLMKWIENQNEVTPVAFANWHVIPQDWWRAAKKRDYELIYGEKASE